MADAGAGLISMCFLACQWTWMPSAISRSLTCGNSGSSG